MWRLASRLVIACTIGALLVLAVTGVMGRGPVASAIRSVWSSGRAPGNEVEQEEQPLAFEQGWDTRSDRDGTDVLVAGVDSLICGNELPIAAEPSWWTSEAPVSTGEDLAGVGEGIPGTSVDWSAMADASGATMDGRTLLRVVARMLESTRYLEE